MPVFVPTVPASPVGPWVALNVQGEANLLSANDAGNTASGSVGIWQVFPGTSLTQTGPAAPDGSTPIRATLNGAAQVWVFFAAASAPVAVPGQVYSGVAACQAVTTGRSFQAQLQFLDSGGSVINPLSPSGASAVGTWQSDFAGSYTTATVTAVAPPGTAKVELQVEIDGSAAAEQHYIASRAILPGTVTTWSEGGQAGLETATVQYSDDGTTWVTVPYANLPVSLPGPSQQATVTDYTPFPNTPRQYRTQTTDSNGKVSAWSAPISATTSPDRPWLVDPTQPGTDANGVLGRASVLRIKGGSSTGGTSGLATAQVWSRDQSQSLSYGLDESFPVVLQGPLKAATSSLACYVEGQAAKVALVGRDNMGGLLGRRRTLLWQTDGYEQFFIVPGAPVSVEMIRELPAERRANPKWVISFPVTATAAP